MAQTRQDCEKRAIRADLIAAVVTPAGDLESMRRQWLALAPQGAQTAGTVQERWRRLFLFAGVTSAHLDDMAMDWLALPAQGLLTGNLDDRWKKYWCTKAGPP